jgi:hypothetical protein
MEMANGTPAASAASTTQNGMTYTKPGQHAWISKTMRTSGPQQFDTEVFPLVAGAINVQKNIPLLQPLAHLMIRLKGRLTVTANITDAPPEAIMNLFSQIKIFGNHTALGAETPFQMTGEMAHALPLLLDRAKGILAMLKINGTYFTLNDIAKGTITPTFFTAAGSPYDFEVWWLIPTYPFGCTDFNAMQYLWDARSWGQTLQIQLQTRDASATGAFGTTGTKTLSAFGSGAGNPTVDINVDYANLSPAIDASIAKAVVVRVSQFISSIVQTAAGSGTRLLLLQNKKTLNVLVKTGTIETGSNNVYATLSDSILEQTILQKNSTPIRNLQFNDVTDVFYQFRDARTHMPGHLLLSLSDGEPANNPHAALRANEWSASTQFNLASQVVGASASNIAEALQEYVDGEPVIATAA